MTRWEFSYQNHHCLNNMNPGWQQQQQGKIASAIETRDKREREWGDILNGEIMPAILSLSPPDFEYKIQSPLRDTWTKGQTPRSSLQCLTLQTTPPLKRQGGSVGILISINSHIPFQLRHRIHRWNNWKTEEFALDDLWKTIFRLIQSPSLSYVYIYIGYHMIQFCVLVLIGFLS